MRMKEDLVFKIRERITDHAVERYRERVSMTDTGIVRTEMAELMAMAKPKHLRGLWKGKNTAMIPTSACIFVCSEGKIVTVLQR